MGNFAEKHPKAAQWIREGGLFLIFSYVVTFIKWALLTFLPALFVGLVGSEGWGWPGIDVTIAGVPLQLNIIGNAAADGGDEEFELLVLPGEGGEALDGRGKILQAFHGRYGVGLSL